MTSEESQWLYSVVSSLPSVLTILAILFTTPPVSLAGPGSETSAQIRPGETLTGKATVYPNQLNGHKTSTGETFHQTGHTGASNHLPLRTHVKVTNLENGKSTHVKINDRGPKLGKHKIDLSKKAAAEIGLTHKQGTAPVTINVTSTPDTSPGSVSR